MKVSGFTFIKNGLSLGYPIKESIESIAPLCDEVVINVGFDDQNLEENDGTYKYLKGIFTDKKFRFLKNYWDPEMTSQGLVLSQQTNLAIEACTGDVGLYIQGDECLHEEDHEEIQRNLEKLHHDSKAEGLIFRYTHFYGNVDCYLYTRRIYRREVRAIKLGQGIKSHLDAQGFKNALGEKCHCFLTKAKVFHYGWARAEKVMAKKVKAMDKLYHGQEFEAAKKFSYQRIWGLKKFRGTHPQVMQEWIAKNRNSLDIMSLPRVFSWSDISLAISDSIEALTGWRLGEYRNYKIL